MERLTIDEVIAHCQRHTDRVERSAAVLAFKEGNMPETAKKQYQEHKQVKEWLEELKEYKAAEEQEVMLRLPCRIGDVVYTVCSCGIECGVVGSIEVFPDRIFVNDIHGAMIGEANNIFLTEEEAEQALAKMKGV